MSPIRLNGIENERSPEDLLILNCSRTEIDEHRRGLIGEFLRRDPDWNRVIEDCFKHAVSGMVYRSLKVPEARGLVPESVMRCLEKAYYGNVERNTRICCEVATLLKALSDSKINVLLTKGTALLGPVYGNPGLRAMGDGDLIVHEDDFPIVKDVLGALGYAPERPLPELSPRDAVRYTHYFEQLRFCRQSNRVIVEIHFRLVNMGVPKREDAVWNRSTIAEIEGVQARAPSVEDSLFHLCLHANQHAFDRLSSFCDVNELLRFAGGDVDWEYFSRIVDERRTRASAYYSLQLARELLGAEPPAEILEGLRPGAAKRRLFEYAWKVDDVLSLKSTERPVSAQAPVFYLLEVDTLGDKIAYAWRLMVPPARWLSSKYGEARRGRLYLKHLASIWQNVMAVLLAGISGRKPAGAGG